MARHEANTSVIDNNITPVSPVIDNNIPDFLSPREQFEKWADSWLEAQQVRDRARMGAGTFRFDGWWKGLPESLRCYLLTVVAPDDWERYMQVPFSGMPEPLRRCICNETRKIRERLSWGWWK